MKKILLILLCLVVVVSISEAKIVKDSLYQIPFTKVAPVIDGQLDQIWKALDWNFQRIYNVGDPPDYIDAWGTTGATVADSGVGLTGLSKAMYDKTNLYILFYSVDDVIIDIPANAGWNQDAIELYFDGSNNHATETSLAAGQYQWTFPHWLKGQEVGHLYEVFGTTGFDTTGVAFAIHDVPETENFPGWMLEVQIPLATLGVDPTGIGAAGTMVGWEMQQDECDDATIGRQAMSKWWSSSNNSWANAGIWGTALLSGQRVIDTVLEIASTSAAITIDGQMDNAYLNANPVTADLYRVGDPYTAGSDIANTDPMFGGMLTAYPLWDATNIYMFIDVVDAVITNIPANPGWNQDAVEVYFDGTNNHAGETSLAAGQYQFTIPEWIKGQEIGNLGTAFGTTVDTTGIELKIVDRPDARGNTAKGVTEEGSGYNVEFKIPLAALGIDGSAPGAQLGFELQQDNCDDATAGRQGMGKWWNSSNNSWANAALWGWAKLGAASDVSVKSKSSAVVQKYTLEQNYPNPFNPSTKITFSLTKSEKVRLTVYNILGKQVAELVNGVMSAESHTVTFNANNLASGVYFYKLQAGSTVLAKKMMLLK